LFSWVTTRKKRASYTRSACWNACAPKLNLVRGAYDGLYQRVDKLLRELANPNLHDIANMSFRVELWDRHALHIRWVVAAAGSVSIARVAFDEATKNWPDEHFTLRQGRMVIRAHSERSGR
jgi:hypothetical protein